MNKDSNKSSSELEETVKSGPSFVLTEEQYIALRKQRRARQIKHILSRPGWIGGDMEVLYKKRNQMQIKLDFKTPFVVCGGWAVNEYGWVGFTKDIDILVKPSHLDFINQEISLQGGTPNFSLEDIPGVKGICHSWYIKNEVLDVLTWDDKWISTAVDNPGKQDELGNSIIALPYLVLMKLDSSRAKDTGHLESILGFPQNKHLLPEVRKVITKYRPNYVDDLETEIILSQHLYSTTK